VTGDGEAIGGADGDQRSDRLGSQVGVAGILRYRDQRRNGGNGMPVRYVSRSILAAMMKSLRDKPLTVWVQSVTRTFPQVTVSSG
jgi:hypothetical protein